MLIATNLWTEVRERIKGIGWRNGGISIGNSSSNPSQHTTCSSQPSPQPSLLPSPSSTVCTLEDSSAHAVALSLKTTTSCALPVATDVVVKLTVLLISTGELASTPLSLFADPSTPFNPPLRATVTDPLNSGNYAAQGCSGCLIRTGSFMICHCPGGDKIADLSELCNFVQSRDLSLTPDTPRRVCY